MNEEVRIELNTRKTEKLESLEGRISKKTMVEEIIEIFNPLRSARLLSSNTSSERNPLLAKTLYGLGLTMPYIVIVSAIGTVWAGGYGIKEGIEKYLFYNVRKSPEKM